MKTRLFILIFALVASAGTLFAESGTLGDNATWNYADGVLTISGTGAMTDFANLIAVPWNAYRRDTRTIIIEDALSACICLYCTVSENIFGRNLEL